MHRGRTVCVPERGTAVRQRTHARREESGGTVDAVVGVVVDAVVGVAVGGTAGAAVSVVVGAVPVPPESTHTPGAYCVRSGIRGTVVRPWTIARRGNRQSRLSTMSSLPFFTAMKAQFPVISLETAN